MYTPTLTPKNQTLKTLTQQLRAQTHIDALYCFAFTNTTASTNSVILTNEAHHTTQEHYSLLMVAETLPPNFIADATETIRQQSQQTLSVTLLTCKTTAIGQEGEHQWWLHQIMTKGLRVYRRRSQRHLLRFTTEPTRDYEHTEKQWRYRKYMATCYREAESAIENPNGDVVQVSLLHAALEQLCLGLIYVFLGYKPQSFGINYLLRVCDLFTTLSAELFPERTLEDKRLLKVLGTNHQTIRHQPNLKMSITDVETIRSRVCNFEIASYNLAEKQLELLKPHQQ